MDFVLWSASSQITQALTNSHASLVADQHTLLTAIAHLLDAAVSPLREEVERLRDAASIRAALGPDALIPYGEFLKANHLSYELGQRLRDSGQLKVLRAGSKLVVRKGHAAEFARNLPLD